MTTDIKGMTDMELVTQWLVALKSSNPADALALLAEAERRGHKRISKAFEVINSK